MTNLHIFHYKLKWKYSEKGENANAFLYILQPNVHNAFLSIFLFLRKGLYIVTLQLIIG